MTSIYSRSCRSRHCRLSNVKEWMGIRCTRSSRKHATLKGTFNQLARTRKFVDSTSLLPLKCRAASRWAGKRALEANPHFSWNQVKSMQDSEPVFFTAEMVKKAFLPIELRWGELLTDSCSSSHPRCLMTTSASSHGRKLRTSSLRTILGVRCMTLTNLLGMK